MRLEFASLNKIPCNFYRVQPGTGVDNVVLLDLSVNSLGAPETAPLPLSAAENLTAVGSPPRGGEVHYD